MQKDNIEETPQEESQELKHWQWIKGDDTGNVVTIKNEDDKWINFNNGTRLAKDLKAEFIQPLEADIAGELLKTQTPIGMPSIIHGHFYSSHNCRS